MRGAVSSRDSYGGDRIARPPRGSPVELGRIRGVRFPAASITQDTQRTGLPLGHRGRTLGCPTVRMQMRQRAAVLTTATAQGGAVLVPAAPLQALHLSGAVIAAAGGNTGTPSVPAIHGGQDYHCHRGSMSLMGVGA